MTDQHNNAISGSVKALSKGPGGKLNLSAHGVTLSTIIVTALTVLPQLYETQGTLATGLEKAQATIEAQESAIRDLEARLDRFQGDQAHDKDRAKEDLKDLRRTVRWLERSFRQSALLRYAAGDDPPPHPPEARPEPDEDSAP